MDSGTASLPLGYLPKTEVQECLIPEFLEPAPNNTVHIDFHIANAALRTWMSTAVVVVAEVRDEVKRS